MDAENLQPTGTPQSERPLVQMPDELKSSIEVQKKCRTELENAIKNCMEAHKVSVGEFEKFRDSLTGRDVGDSLPELYLRIQELSVKEFTLSRGAFILQTRATAEADLRALNEIEERKIEEARQAQLREIEKQKTEAAKNVIGTLVESLNTLAQLAPQHGFLPLQFAAQQHQFAPQQHQFAPQVAASNRGSNRGSNHGSHRGSHRGIHQEAIEARLFRLSQTPTDRRPMWKCRCGFENYSFRERCFSCGHDKHQ